MSADLLRRAASKLREHANAALQDPEERWMVDQSPDDGLVLGSYMPDDVLPDGNVMTSCLAYFAYPDDQQRRAHSHALGVASYAALVHPPVALVLADLLDRIAVMPQMAVMPSIREYAEALARAILREPS